MWPAIISAGASLLGGLFGGGKQTTTRGLSPEAQAYLKMLYGKMGKLPSYLLNPIRQQYGALKQGIRESTGEALGAGSGLETANLMKATAGEARATSEAGEKYDLGLFGEIGGVLGGTGTQTTTGTTDWGGILGGAGEDVGLLWGLQQMLNLGKNKAGGGGSITPGFKNKFQLQRPKYAYGGY